MDAPQHSSLSSAYGRETSGGADRPTTSGGIRPGTSRGGPQQARTITRGTTADARYDEDLEQQWEEEYENESDEDGDVFAFVPPFIGPPPATIANDEVLTEDADRHAQHDGHVGHPEAPTNFGLGNARDLKTAGASPSPTFYLDESSGALYDDQGRLVQPNPSLQKAVAKGTAPPASMSGEPSEVLIHNVDAKGPDFRSFVPSPRASMDRKTSNASSFVGATPALHSSVVGYEDPRFGDAQPFEEASIMQQEGDMGFIRKRTNRLSEGADGPASPDNELKFNLDYSDDAGFAFDQKLDRYSSELGQGAGLAHGIDYDTGDIGPRGIKMVELELEGDEDSPYPEVRASVSNVDDVDMPINTFRMWLIALFLTMVGAGINAVLVLRYPAPTVTPLIIQVLSYPLGKAFALLLPYKTFYLPSWLGGSSWSLNPGMFNIKEHTAIVLMANAGLVQIYALNAVVALDSAYFYDLPKGSGYGVLLALSSQLCALGLAGVTRKFLVRPASMIWPQVLVYCTVFNTLHAGDDDVQSGKATISRFRYFVYLAAGAFVWWFFPGWIFTALSSFSWVCWIWPESFAVNTLFGTATGLGMGFLTFDWQLIAYNVSPLVSPWWAQGNIFGGFVFFLWLIGPILYWTNVYGFSYLPFNSSGSWDRFGESYNVAAILQPGTTSLNVDAYQSYSRLYLSTTFFLVLWTGFATMTAVLVHTALYYGPSILRGLRGVQTEEADIHAKMMLKYKEAPYWWYIVVTVGSFVLGVVCCEIYDTDLPVWALLLCLIVIPGVYFLPSGFIYALTGNMIGTNLVSEMVVGYALPGKAMANMMFKLYSQVGISQGFLFAQDLKLAHYMKLPPRLTFAVMFIGTVWSCIVQVFVNLFMNTHVADICSPENEHQFTCPQAQVYYTSSIVWGVIGPRRMFSEGSFYSSMYWALLVGALTPIPVFLASRRWPNSFLKGVNVPLIFTSTSLIPPASGIVVSSWFLTGFIFQYVIRKRAFRWWSRYNFITSAAMDTGTILSSIAVFLFLVLPKDGSIQLSWWGNDVVGRTLDGNPSPRLMSPADGFAPPPNHRAP